MMCVAMFAPSKGSFDGADMLHHDTLEVGSRLDFVVSQVDGFAFCDPVASDDEGVFALALVEVVLVHSSVCGQLHELGCHRSHIAPLHSLPWSGGG